MLCLVEDALDEDAEVLKITVLAQCVPDPLEIEPLPVDRVDLDRVLAADGHSVLLITIEKLEPLPDAARAIRVSGAAQIDSAALPFPEVKLQERPHHAAPVPEQELQGLAGLI